jgi:hypothetical protein
MLCCGGPVLFMVFVGFKASAQIEEEKQKVAEGRDAVKVTAKDLYDAFHANEVSANSKYKDKVVEVTGEVHGVKERYVELSESDQFSGGLVHVTFDSNSKNKMSSLKKGDKIKVRGICKGNVFFSVDIDKALLLD